MNWQKGNTQWIMTVLLAVTLLGCGLGDDSPAQLLEVKTLIDANGAYIKEVHFNKAPKDLSVDDAREYRLSGKKLVILEGCVTVKDGIITKNYRFITVTWQGGQKRIYVCTSGGRTRVDWEY